MTHITSFQGEYRWLSNFHRCRIIFEGREYPSSEHAYVAAKTTEESRRRYISYLSTPGAAKRYGRKFTLRPDWDDIKLDVMYQIVKAKFTAHKDLAIKLVGTGDVELVEGNTWGDVFWGKCRGHGKNHLGKILMQVREELKDDPLCEIVVDVKRKLEEEDFSGLI